MFGEQRHRSDGCWVRSLPASCPLLQSTEKQTRLGAATSQQQAHQSDPDRTNPMRQSGLKPASSGPETTLWFAVTPAARPSQR